MRTYTEEEIRAAMEKTVAPNTDAVWFAGKVSDVMAELKRPAIHPDVPVMYDYEGGHCKLPLNLLQKAKHITASDVNIRVLIPAQLVQEWCRGFLTGTREHIADCIERYTREGK